MSRNLRYQVLAQFRQSQWIGVGYNSIQILNAAALVEIASPDDWRHRIVVTGEVSP